MDSLSCLRNANHDSKVNAIRACGFGVLRDLRGIGSTLARILASKDCIAEQWVATIAQCDNHPHFAH